MTIEGLLSALLMAGTVVDRLRALDADTKNRWKAAVSKLQAAVLETQSYVAALNRGERTPKRPVESGRTSPASLGGTAGPLQAMGQTKVDICHRTEGTNEFILISIADPAVETHIAHGDGRVGDPVPKLEGYVFDETCTPVATDACTAPPQINSVSPLNLTTPAVGGVIVDGTVTITGTHFEGGDIFTTGWYLLLDEATGDASALERDYQVWLCEGPECPDYPQAFEWIVTTACGEARVSATLFSGADAGPGPTLIVDDAGQLLGADGVDVEGTLYDVRFLIGTCIDLFEGCDEGSDFPFVEPTQATRELLNQVFVDGPSGNFDSDPSLTFGCDAICSVSIPALPLDTGVGAVYVGFAQN